MFYPILSYSQNFFVFDFIHGIIFDIRTIITLLVSLVCLIIATKENDSLEIKSHDRIKYLFWFFIFSLISIISSITLDEDTINVYFHTILIQLIFFYSFHKFSQTKYFKFNQFILSLMGMIMVILVLDLMRVWLNVYIPYGIEGIVTMLISGARTAHDGGANLYTTRVFGASFGDEIGTSNAIVLIMPWIYYYLRRFNEDKIIKIFVPILLLLCGWYIIISMSRGPIIILVILIIYSIYLSKSMKLKTKFSIFLMGVLITLALYNYTGYLSRYKGLETYLDNEDNVELEIFGKRIEVGLSTGSRVQSIMIQFEILGYMFYPIGPRNIGDLRITQTVKFPAFIQGGWMGYAITYGIFAGGFLLLATVSPIKISWKMINLFEENLLQRIVNISSIITFISYSISLYPLMTYDTINKIFYVNYGWILYVIIFINAKALIEIENLHEIAGN